MSQSKQSRQADWIAPPGKPTSFNAVQLVSVTTASQAIDLHAPAQFNAPSRALPAGYYIAVQVVSGGPVHFFFSDVTTAAATSSNGATLTAGQTGSFLLDGPTDPSGTIAYAHRYLMIIGDASAVVKWWVATHKVAGQ